MRTERDTLITWRFVAWWDVQLPWWISLLGADSHNPDRGPNTMREFAIQGTESTFQQKEISLKGFSWWSDQDFNLRTATVIYFEAIFCKFFLFQRPLYLGTLQALPHRMFCNRLHSCRQMSVTLEYITQSGGRKDLSSAGTWLCFNCAPCLQASNKCPVQWFYTNVE